MTSPTDLRVAVIGAGPAGIYASDLLAKQGVNIDLFEQMPAPFGLIRYGVAPDHPRIKGIVNSLHAVMEKPNVRFLGNIEIGTTITVEKLHEYYDAIVFATGAVADRDLDIPGENLNGSYGAADFVGFYDGNPRFHRTWNLTATHIAIIGVGNVALDISRILAKTANELHTPKSPTTSTKPSKPTKPPTSTSSDDADQHKPNSPHSNSKNSTTPPASTWW